MTVCKDRRIGLAKWRMAVSCLALAASSSVYAKPKKIQQQTVEVDGKAYRVAVYDNNTALIASKSFVVVYDIEERARQRKAAEIVTGCKVSDELPNGGAKTMGKLDCSETRKP